MQANVLEWLGNSAKRIPDKLALWDENELMTYSEYQEKSMGIAQAIIDAGVEARKLVVVYLNKNIKVLASFMGIVYSGCFYSPIDTEMPAARVNKILRVLEPMLVITTKELVEEFRSFNYHGGFLYYECRTAN